MSFLSCSLPFILNGKQGASYDPSVALFCVGIFKKIFCFQASFNLEQILFLFFSDVIKSGIGFLVWVAGLTAWILIYQKYRASWGEIGDRISFVIPLGEP